MCAHIFFYFLWTFTNGSERIDEEKVIDLFPCVKSWQYGLAGDHPSRRLCHSDKARLQSKASAWTSRSVDARLCVHLVSAVVLSSQWVMLQSIVSLTACSAGERHLL